MHWRPWVTRFVRRLSVSFLATWVIACRQTARHEKATSTSIATHNFNTSTRRAAQLILQRLADAGFAVVPADGDDPAADLAEAEMLRAIRAWLRCPAEKRPSAAALGQRIAAIAGG
jgi:hypothetical protein